MKIWKRIVCALTHDVTVRDMWTSTLEVAQMKVRELIQKLLELDLDADVYYSTGSSMDDTFGEQHEVESVSADRKMIGIATAHPTMISIVVLEGI
jgi:hypothetical protein